MNASRLILLCVISFAFAVAAESPASMAIPPSPSSGEEHLQRWLRRFPAADADRDGRLTAEEAWRYHGQAPQRAREEKAKQERLIVEAAKAGLSVPAESRLLPHLANVSYGPHERHVLDVWIAKSAKPTPLVVFFHGGAWKIGDKRDIHDPTVQACLAAGISVAAVNYRFTTSATLPAQFLDAARAVQFLRSRAESWNLDSSRIAAYGASAGAVMSMWLGFHPDLADVVSRDPIARRSTRLTCIGSINGQCTVNPFVIRDWIGEPAFQHGVFPAAYGVKSHAELSDPKLRLAFDEMSPITYLTRDDPPVFESYTEPDAPVPTDALRGQGMHHPIFGHKLKAAMDTVGVACVYVHIVDIAEDPELLMVQFFQRHFGLR